VVTRLALKAATDDVHRELDERLSRLDLACSADYRRFLAFHARTVPPFEEALAAAGASRLIDDWDSGRRAEAIETDLAALGEPMPKPVAVAPIRGLAELLGTAYVIEGSRLGGKVLRRRVGTGLPASFLGHSRHTPWPAVVAALDRLLYSDQLLAEAQATARRCFGLFLSTAREDGIG
jgi:heme oxygenase